MPTQFPPEHHSPRVLVRLGSVVAPHFGEMLARVGFIAADRSGTLFALTAAYALQDARRGAVINEAGRQVGSIITAAQALPEERDGRGYRPVVHAIAKVRISEACFVAREPLAGWSQPSSSFLLPDTIVHR